MLPPTRQGGTAAQDTSHLFRSRSGGLVAALFVSSLATGVLEISIPLKLGQLRASPNEIGVTLAMFGLGLFVFEWFWGLVADRIGYRAPLVVAHLLYAGAIILLASAGSVLLIAISYLLAAGMMVAAGPIGRSYVGTSLPQRLRATGLALLTSAWVVGAAIGAGAGGLFIDRFPIRSVLYGSALLPVAAALMILLVFVGYSDRQQLSETNEGRPRGDKESAAGSVARVLLVTASIILLIQIGLGGEMALLPLLVTSHLHLSAATAGSAMFAVGLLGGLLLVPGGSASDRWGRKPTMIIGGILCAAGYLVYSIAGAFWPVILGAGLRAAGLALIWPAATAWIAESMPRRGHAAMMGIFGEFENAGLTVGPILGGLAWSLAGIQAAFVTYAVAAGAAAVIATVFVHRRTSP